jgi:gas vesicle protein
MASLVNLNPEMLASILDQLFQFKESVITQKKVLDEKEKNIPCWDDEQFTTFQAAVRDINNQLDKQIDAIQKEIERLKQYIDDTKKAKDNFR